MSVKELFYEGEEVQVIDKVHDVHSHQFELKSTVNIKKIGTKCFYCTDGNETWAMTESEIDKL